MWNGKQRGNGKRVKTLITFRRSKVKWAKFSAKNYIRVVIEILLIFNLIVTKGDPEK